MGSSREISSMSVHTTITKLTAEIAKLKAVTAFTKAELEERLVEQRKAMLAKVEEEEENLLKEEKQLETVRDEIKNKEEYIRYIHRRTETRDEELRLAEEQRREIQKGFDELSLEYEDLRANVDMMDGEISTLLESMSYLLRDQENIVESSLALEDKMEEEANKRIERLQELLDVEIENKKKSSEMRMIGSGKKLTDTIIEQKEEMKTIIDSLSHDRFNKDNDDDSPSSPKLLLTN
eukprot:CAMPEP_0203704906 /NCGR_PEP_ID=MMETSP0091-20130426/48178_1 /ASSEMBLY_ACC=CAM_ASM_001089 /TAXON_ID=426623 /ORGANISM="Chaetoceros affinis, Strain CCMP159" /LENGTH=235 /DNA_ID=CAMNT_0050580097 /DNA_START=289 /DNA_END=996 /DNA_ORIENTATION=+